MVDFDLLCEISDYAKAHTENCLKNYISRGEERREKIFHDCLNGKLAEFSLYFHLIKKRYQLQRPDITIYEQKNKSFDADLIVTAKDGELFDKPMYLHVKSMTKRCIEIYGHSIVCQRKDPIVKRPDKNHWIVAMEEIDFITYKPFKWINTWDADWRDTITNRPSKCALYLD